MGFDCLLDLFGKFRKKKTRFSDVEKQARDLMSKYAGGIIQKINSATGWNRWKSISAI